MYQCIVNYLNYVIVDSDPAESWNLRREARASFKKLENTTVEIVKKTAASCGLISHFFAAPPAAKGSLREVGQKLTKDLLVAGYSVEKTATTLFTTAAGGVANIPNTVSLRNALLVLRVSNAKTTESLFRFSTGFSRRKMPSTGLRCRS